MTSADLASSKRRKTGRVVLEFRDPASPSSHQPNNNRALAFLNTGEHRSTGVEGDADYFEFKFSGVSSVSIAADLVVWNCLRSKSDQATMLSVIQSVQMRKSMMCVICSTAVSRVENTPRDEI